MFLSNRFLYLFFVFIFASSARFSFSQTPLDVFSLDDGIGNSLNLEDDLENFSILRINETNYQSFQFQQNGTFRLRLPIDARTSVEVELTEQNIFAADFSVIEKTPRGDQVVNFEKPLYYRGTVIGETQSSAGFTIAKDQLYGVFSFGGNTYNLELTSRDSRSDYYVIYKQEDFKYPLVFECDTDYDTDPALPSIRSNDNSTTTASAAATVNIYVECDYQMYLENNSSTSATTTYATNLFNMVAGIYSSSANTTLNLSEVVVWSMPDPYGAENLSSSQLLDLFECQHTDGAYNGRIAHLLTTAPVGGGIANRPDCPDSGTYNNPVYGVSGIDNQFNSDLSVYSWDINVFAHELGHQFSSPHTHDCAWGANGDEPIDCCGANSGYGTCACNVGVPNKGTIMSYCHLTGGGSGNPGIDLSLGFHPQVAAKIQNFASCVSTNVMLGCPVPAPEEISFSSINNTSVTVTTTATGDVFAYAYQDVEAGGFVCAVCSGLTENNREVTISGLSPCTTYAVAISAYCFSTSSWSPWSSFSCGDVTFMTTGPACTDDLGDGECEPSMTISDSDVPGSAGIFRAATTIITDGNAVVVSPSETVSFLAGNSVTLNAGFYAQSGSVFVADIENCSPTVQEEIPVEALARNNGSTINQEQLQTESLSNIQLSVRPNPFTNRTILHIDLAQREQISVFIFNLNGQLVEQIIQKQPVEAGIHTIGYDATDLSEGLYQLVLKTDTSIQTEKLIVLK